MSGAVPLTGHCLGQELLALTARGRPEQAHVDPAGVLAHAASDRSDLSPGGDHQRRRALNDTLPR